jgi:hypothetical protein
MSRVVRRTIAATEDAMTRTAQEVSQLADLEEDIFRGECLIGRIAALAAISSARGRSLQAKEARRMMASVTELLEPLYTARRRLRHGSVEQRQWL